MKLNVSLVKHFGMYVSLVKDYGMLFFPCKGLWNAYEDVLFCYNRSMFIPRGSTTDRQGKDIFSFKKVKFLYHL